MHALLLCPPDHYGIEYEINPWMSRSRGADANVAARQWRGLLETLRTLDCEVHQIAPQPGQPDMVFTANAGLASVRKFFPSHFRHPERQGEEAHFGKWFADRGCEIVRLPDGLYFEGEGDALFCGDILFCGYKFRSDIRSHQFLARELQCLAVSIELVDGRFYHLDTCFCPLAPGLAMWFPAAFDDYGQRAVRHHVHELIEVPPEEALRFACNAVVIGSHVVLPEDCREVCEALARHDFQTHSLPMSEFIKAGGACKCLTLFLPWR